MLSELLLLVNLRAHYCTTPLRTALNGSPNLIDSEYQKKAAGPRCFHLLKFDLAFVPLYLSIITISWCLFSLFCFSTEQGKSLHQVAHAM